MQNSNWATGMDDLSAPSCHRSRRGRLALFIVGGIFFLSLAAFPAMLIVLGAPNFAPPRTLSDVPFLYWLVLAGSFALFVTMIIWRASATEKPHSE